MKKLIHFTAALLAAFLLLASSWGQQSGRIPSTGTDETITGNWAFTKSIAVGTTVTSPQYCIGLSCITAWPSGSGGGGSWGSITGTLSSQADLQGVLNSKAASNASTTVNGQTCALGSTCTVSDATKVPTSTTVNGHALTSNVVVSASDITTGTLPHAQLPALLSGDIPNNAANTSGNAATATALAATPSKCSAGNYPLGVDAQGNAQNCTAAGGGSGTVTHTSGALTSGAVMIGNGSADAKVDPNITTDGSGNLTAASFSTSGTPAAWGTPGTAPFTLTAGQAGMYLDGSNRWGQVVYGGAFTPFVLPRDVAGSDLGLTKSGACSSGYHADGTYNADGTPHCSADTGGTGDTWVVASPTPSFSPAAGSVADGTSVTASCSSGTCYMSTDGSSLAGSCTNAVHPPQTIYARCELAGAKPTNATAAYTALSQVATPTFSPSSGTVPISVTINDSTASATCFYTTDGSTPTHSGATATGTSTALSCGSSFSMSSAGTIEALAYKSGMTDSAVATSGSFTASSGGQTITTTVLKVGTSVPSTASPAATVTVASASDLLVWCVAANKETNFTVGAPTDNNSGGSNTWSLIGAGTDVGLSLTSSCWRTQPGHTGSLTVTGSISGTAAATADRQYVTILEIHGSTATPAIDGYAAGSLASGATWTLPVTVGTTGDTLMGFAGNAGASYTYSAATGFTLLDASGRQITSYKSATVSSGAQNMQWTVSTATAGVGVAWAVK